MDVLRLVNFLAVLAAVAAGASYAHPAAAARPTKGARYYGLEGRLSV